MAVRIKIHDNNTATLSGISYRTLREILTAAALNTYDSEDKAKKDPDERKGKESRQYHRGLRRHIKLADDAMQVAIKATFRDRDQPPTKASRLRAVQEARRERLVIEKIMDEIHSGGDPKAATIRGILSMTEKL